MKKHMKSVIFSIFCLSMLAGCGSGSATALNNIPGVPTAQLPPTAGNINGGELQVVKGYQIRGTLSEVITPTSKSNGYQIRGGVQ